MYLTDRKQRLSSRNTQTSTQKPQKEEMSQMKMKKSCQSDFFYEADIWS